MSGKHSGPTNSSDVPEAETTALITVEVPNTQQQARDTHTAVLSRSVYRVLPVYIWASCLYASIVYVSLLTPKRLFTLDSLETAVLIVLLFSSSFLWLPGWRARRDKPAKLLMGVPSQWRFTATRVMCQTGEHARSDFDWGVLHGAEKLTDGLLLFPLRTVAEWLPRSAFASDQDFDQVADWAAAGSPRYRQRRKRRLAEWVAALLIAPPAIALTLYVATLIESGKGVLDSFPTLMMVMPIALAHSYVAGWILGAPVYGVLARFTKRPIFFLGAGAVLGSIQVFAGMLSIFPVLQGLLAWSTGFGLGALVHWYIAVREG